MFGHSPIAKSFTLYSYVFNMPMFFLLSGYFLNIKKYNFYFDYFKNLFKKIMKPYIWFSIVSVIFYAIYYRMPYYDYFTMRAMLKVFLLATRNIIFYNVPLWFLPTLFFVANVFYFVKKIKNKWLQLLAVLIPACFFVVAWDTVYNPKLPWTIDSGFFYLIFFSLGYYIKNNVFKIVVPSKIIEIIIFATSFLLNTLVIFVPAFQKTLLRSTFVSSFPLAYFAITLLLAFSGIYVILKISQIIKRNRILEYLGQNSLNYFALHVLIFLILNKIIRPIEFLSRDPVLLSIIYVLTATILLVPINWIVNKNLFKKNNK